MTTLIIGAGLCGLWTAQLLKSAGFKSITVLEKSKGVGGRLATRRTTNSKFDHGAQFYSLKPDIQSLHDRWLSEKLTDSWFISKDTKKYNSKNGMTALAKSLAAELDIHLEQKANQIINKDNKWHVLTDSGQTFSADQLIITSPLPQALDLLRKSNLAFDHSLSQIQYAKALVALIENPQSGVHIEGEVGYQEFTSGELFSIADQFKKGVSPQPAWTVTMSPNWSELYFENSDEAIQENIILALQKLDPDFKFQEIQIKKWRFSHPLSHFEKLFVESSPKLFLAGDAFARPSLNGAAASATALANYLVSNSSI